jgi:hypothetical protein
MIIKKFVSATLLFVCLGLEAQVPRKVIVEHFTNTVCSVCANRNPGFRNNLQATDSLLYISYHPSSPYPTCVMNLQNKKENDDRTRFYGVYGSTPRLVIQGSVIPAAANYAAPALFTPYLNQTSPFSMRLLQYKKPNVGIIAKVVIKAEATHQYEEGRLYFAVAEDTIDYAAPNGEKKHYNVFREALTDSNGILLQLPKQVGDSIIFTITSPLKPAWDIDKVILFSILQELDTKKVIQAEMSKAEQSDKQLGIESIKSLNNIRVYPNPSYKTLHFKSADRPTRTVEIIDPYGAIILTEENVSGEIDISSLPDGIYMLRLQDEDYTTCTRFQKISP